MKNSLALHQGRVRNRRYNETVVLHWESSIAGITHPSSCCIKWLMATFQLLWCTVGKKLEGNSSVASISGPGRQVESVIIYNLWCSVISLYFYFFYHLLSFGVASKTWSEWVASLASIPIWCHLLEIYCKWKRGLDMTKGSSTLVT